MLQRKLPSFLNYIAGEKNGSSVVLVFLQNGDQKKAEDYFARNSSCRQAEFKVVNVNTDFPAGIEKKTRCLIEKNTRDEMMAIIKNEEKKLMAIHSTVIGLGCCISENLQKPCFLLYCVDKTLVPYGEEKLPTEIKGYSVEFREDFVMCGQWLDHRSLNDGNSLVEPCLFKKGEEVYVRVKSRKERLSLRESCFLTSDHVATAFMEFYEKNALLLEYPFSGRYRQPLESKEEKVVDYSNDDGDTEKNGFDSACVTIPNPKSIGTFF